MIKTIIHYLSKNKFKNCLDINDVRSFIPKNKEIAILGSGSSILKIQPNDLNDKFKIGFNFWIYHEIIPDLYVFEIKPRDTSRFIFLCELIKIRENELKDVIFLIKDFELNNKLNISLVNKYFPKELRKNLSFTKDKNLFGRNLIQVKLIYQLTRLFFPDYIIKYRASISFIVYICHNFSKIHLFGIDLDSRPHFWNNPNFKSSNLEKLKIPDSTGNHIHRTVDKSSGKVTIDEYLLYLFRIKKLIVRHHYPQKICLDVREV